MEREIKLKLDGMGEWEALRNYFGKHEERLDQVNFYFDTAGKDLEKLKAMLRVRQENGKHFRMAFKRNIRIKGGYFQNEEVETDIDSNLFANMRLCDSLQIEELEPIRCIRRLEIVDPLLLIGKLANLRFRYFLPNGCCVELDRITLPNGNVEYELEAETENPGEVRAIIDQIFQRLGIKVVPQTQTKYERFLSAL